MGPRRTPEPLAQRRAALTFVRQPARLSVSEPSPDPTAQPTVFQISASLDGASHRFPCRSDQTVLNAAEAAGVPLPSSCCSGVCTTCAALLRSGTVHQPDAMGVKAELQARGYALLCVSYPRSDLDLLAGQEDALYEAQFGQFQK
jgi:ferredoxin